MADFTDLLTASQVAARLPPRRSGRPTHARTVRGWMSQGLRGVKLRYVQVGGSRLTRWEWVLDFFRSLDGGKVVATPRQLSARQRLESMGAR